MQCAKCGYENNKSRSTCIRCGTKLSVAATSARRVTPAAHTIIIKPRRSLLTMLMAGIGVLVVGLFMLGAGLALIDRVVNPPSVSEIAADNMAKYLIDHRPSGNGFEMLNPVLYGDFSKGSRTSVSVMYSYISDNGRRKFERQFYLIDDSGKIIDTRLVTKQPVGLAPNPWP